MQWPYNRGTTHQLYSINYQKLTQYQESVTTFWGVSQRGPTDPTSNTTGHYQCGCPLQLEGKNLKVVLICWTHHVQCQGTWKTTGGMKMKDSLLLVHNVKSCYTYYQRRKAIISLNKLQNEQAIITICLLDILTGTIVAKIFFGVIN